MVHNAYCVACIFSFQQSCLQWHVSELGYLGSGARKSQELFSITPCRFLFASLVFSTVCSTERGSIIFFLLPWRRASARHVSTSYIRTVCQHVLTALNVQISQLRWQINWFPGWQGSQSILHLEKIMIAFPNCWRRERIVQYSKVRRRRQGKDQTGKNDYDILIFDAFQFFLVHMVLHVCPLTILRCKTETDGLKNLLDHTWLSFIGVAFTSQRDYGELFWNIILWYCGERLSKVCWLSLPYPSGKFDNFVPTEENGNVEYMRLTIALFLSSFILQSELHSE